MERGRKKKSSCCFLNCWKKRICSRKPERWLQSGWKTNIPLCPLSRNGAGRQQLLLLKCSQLISIYGPQKLWGIKRIEYTHCALTAASHGRHLSGLNGVTAGLTGSPLLEYTAVTVAAFLWLFLFFSKNKSNDAKILKTKYNCDFMFLLNGEKYKDLNKD